MTEGNSNPADWWERKEGGWQSSSWGAGPTDQVEGPSLTVSHLPKVPWDDLRYLFGEIMYGGHITDDWDRRLCRTYLAEYLQTEMLEGGTLLAPGFQIPPSLDYKVRGAPPWGPHQMHRELTLLPQGQSRCCPVGPHLASYMEYQ